MKRIVWIFAVAIAWSSILSIIFMSIPSQERPGRRPVARSGPAFKASSIATRRSVTEVIESQLSAFRQGDFAKAYEFASRQLQSEMNVAAFETMVKRGFPIMGKSDSAQFMTVLDNGNAAIAIVHVNSSGNQAVPFQYHLVKENGSWKIAGVTPVPKKGNSFT